MSVQVHQVYYSFQNLSKLSHSFWTGHFTYFLFHRWEIYTFMEQCKWKIQNASERILFVRDHCHWGYCYFLGGFILDVTPFYYYCIFILRLIFCLLAELVHGLPPVGWPMRSSLENKLNILTCPVFSTIHWSSILCIPLQESYCIMMHCIR